MSYEVVASARDLVVVKSNRYIIPQEQYIFRNKKLPVCFSRL